MVTYHGNLVGYGSGASWRVEMDVWDSGPTTANAVIVYYQYRIWSNGSIVDSSNTLSWTDPWGGGTRSQPINLGTGGGIVWFSPTPASAWADIWYGGQRGLRFYLYLTGIAGGGTGPSSIDILYYLPARTPVNPSEPGTGVDSITATSARIVVTASANNGGAGIDRYDAYVMSNNAWPGQGGVVVASATGGTFVANNLLPGTTYYYTAQARNAAGLWSGLTAMKVFTTLPAGMVNVNGVWKNALVYVNVGGVWKFALPYTNVNGTWKIA